jgi:hypothetical protein
MAMSAWYAGPVLLSVLIGLLLVLVVWGFQRVRARQTLCAEPDWHDDVLVGTLILAAFAVGIFLTYALLNLFT